MSGPRTTKRAPSDPPTSLARERGTYAAGDVIAGKYELERLLGEGGMGAVWLARNAALDADVAIKLIRREIATAETAQRLLQEARAAARIDHRSIVRVFDFGETEHHDPFLVMEVLHGESLRDALDRKGRLHPANAVRTLLPVASALLAAHAAGIVHRDLKPENVILAEDARGAIVPKIVDFGIAKLRDAEPVSVTRQGTVLGSPEYMSPEQARGREDVDRRADVWAFSVVLYETLTGEKPFAGPNYNAVLTSIVEDTPKPLGTIEGCDAALEAIVLRGLAKRREDRWQSMHDLGRVLAEWALLHDVDTDSAGNSLALEWLEDPQRPLSDRPPPAGASGRFKLATLSDLARISALPGEPPPAPSAQPPPPPVPVVSYAGRQPRSRVPWIVGLGAVALVGGGAALYATRVLVVAGPSASSTAAAQWTAAPEPAPLPSSVAAPPSASAAASAPGPPSASASESAKPAAPVPPVDVSSCAIAHFSPGAFGAVTPDFSGICAETDPRKGGRLFKERVVAGSRGRGTSEAMKEWALLGWYELAAFAVIRGRCCPSRPAFDLPAPIGICPPLDRALDDLGKAAETGVGVDAASERFGAAVRCAVGSNAGVHYGYAQGPPEGARASLRKVLERKPR